MPKNNQKHQFEVVKRTTRLSAVDVIKGVASQCGTYWFDDNLLLFRQLKNG